VAHFHIGGSTSPGNALRVDGIAFASIGVDFGFAVRVIMKTKQ